MDEDSSRLDRRQPNKALTDAYYLNLYRNSLDGMMMTEPDGSILSANPQACLMFGMTEEEIKAAGRSGLVVADEMLEAALRQREETGRSRAEITYRRRDGTTFIGETTSCLFADDDGRVKASIIIRDITERKRAEEFLKKSESWLEKIINSVGDPIFVKDRDHRFTLVNDALCRVMGHSREEILGRTDHDFSQGDPADIFWEKDEEVFSTGMENINDEMITDGQGMVRYITTKKTLYRDPSGSEFIVGTFRDITERRNAEAALMKSEKRLRLTIDAVDDGIWEWNIRTGEALFSPRWYTMLGYEPWELPQSYCSWRMLIHPDDIDRVEEEINKHVASGEGYAIEVRMRTKSREWHWILTRGKVVERDAQGRPVRMMGTHTDIGEHKRSLEALQESEELYRRLFEVESDVLLLMDCESGKIIDANPAVSRMYGYTRDEVLNLGVCDISEQPDKMLRAISRLEERIPLCWHRQKGGTVFPVEIACSYFDFHGRRVMVAAIRDITVRKGIEARLKQSESRYRSLFKHSPIPTLEEDFSKVKARFDSLRSSGISDFREYFRSHPDEVSVLASMVKIIDANQMGMEFFGVGDMGYVPASRSAYFVESSWKVFTEELASLAEGSMSFEDELTVQLANGESKVVYLNLSVVPGCESTLSRVLVSLVDITDRKRMDAIILDQLEFLQQLLDAIPAPVFYKDRNGAYIGCNRAFESYLGRDRSEIIGASAYDLSPRDLADKYLQMDRELFESPGTQIYESSVLYADGTRHDVIFNKAIYRKADGSTAGLIGIILDITERKNAEKVREELFRDLELKNAEMERFTYTVSHDLRSPLITINGFVDLLKTDLQNGPAQRVDADISIIRSAVVRMDKLLSGTLELSRIGRIANPPDSFSFSEVAGDVLSELSEQIRAGKIEAEAACDMPSVYVDRMRIAEVLMNLVENSIKYMGDCARPRIEIGYRQGDGAFYVRDSGIGIDPGQRQKAFELFYKIDRNSQGIGAGLAIVKRIIDVHGGRIWIESTPGGGCTVCFTLPMGPGGQAR